MNQNEKGLGTQETRGAKPMRQAQRARSSSISLKRPSHSVPVRLWLRDLPVRG